MGKRRICVLTYGFYPHASPRSYRATELVKELCRQGHEVLVIAPFREGLATLRETYDFEFIDLGEITWRIPQVRSNNKWINLLNRGLNRGLDLLLEYPAIQLVGKVHAALKTVRHYDALISIAVPYPIHWGVASRWDLKKTQGNPAKVWIADCGDPYMGQENDTFRPPFYFGWVERWFCRKADYLTVPTEGSVQGYYPEFHSKIIVIPQGFRFEDVKVKPVVQSTSRIIFGYGGMFIPGRRDPRELIQILEEAEGEFDFEFHIYTNTPEVVLPYIQSSSSVKIFEPVERMDLMHRFAAMDFLVNFSNVGSIQTPSKLIDYAILEKPVLEVVTGKPDRENIIRFLKGDYSGAASLPNPDQYRIENVVHKFLGLIP